MNILNIKDKRYELIRVIRVDRFEDNEQVLAFRDRCHAETAIKQTKDNVYFFCNELTEVTPIDEPKQITEENTTPGDSGDN